MRISQRATARLDQEEAVSEDPIGGPLTLRHASKRSSGTWGPDDYDVIDGPARRPVMVLGHHRRGGHAHFPSHGNCATLDEAKAKFAETWRAWLAIRR